MEGVFTVEEAASIAGCDRATIYRLIADGWLSRPAGTSKKKTGGRVTQKSLYKLLIVNRLSHLDEKTLRILRKDREVFEKSESQLTQANCYINRESDKADSAPAPLSTTVSEPSAERGKNAKQPKTCLHQNFAIRYQFSFGLRARQLAPNDPAMQDDLMQEMSLAILEYDRPASLEFLFDIAFNRAKNYIKYEAARGAMSLEQARHVTDGFAEKMRSLNAFIDELLQRGVPVAWIEEVIGQEIASGC